MVNKLLDAATFLKSKFQTDELDEKLAEAVTEQNWQASTQLLHEIANASYNFQKQQRILNFILEKLKHKSWKKVLKTLHLVDFLMKYGPSSLINSFKENLYELRNLDNYSLHEGGIDRGESIRKQSKAIVQVLSDQQILNDERAKAKKIKDRMANVIGTGAYYGNYSNESGTNGGSSGNSSIGGKKQTGYQSYNSNNYNFNSGSNNAGTLSFGQTVMASLHKKSSNPPSEPEKIGPSKLNLSKMNQKKPQPKVDDSKKNFNNLALKLVKPPEKKPSDKKTETTIPSPVKPSTKPSGKIDIMDLDLSLSTANTTNTLSQPVSSQSIDPFDFLGNTNAQQPAAVPHIIQQSPKQLSNNFINQPSPNPLAFNFQNPAPPVVPQQQPYSLNLTPTLMTTPQTLNPNPPQPYAFNFNAQPQANTLSFGNVPRLNNNQPINISLNPKPQPKSQKPSASNLIDFSNFREQLSSISSTPQTNTNNNLLGNWNW